MSTNDKSQIPMALTMLRMSTGMTKIRMPNLRKSVQSA